MRGLHNLCGPGVFGFHGEDFPLGTPTKIVMRSHPFASVVPAGHRLALVVAGESSELTPEVRKPQLTVTSTLGAPAEVSIPVVDRTLRLA